MRYMLQLFRIFSFILILSFSQQAISAEVMALSDIHFSPFEGCSNSVKACPLVVKLNQAPADQWPNILAQYSPKHLPQNHQATNYALILAMLSQIKEEHPQNLFILGDFLAHRYRTQYRTYSHDHDRAHYEQFVMKTMQFLIHSIQEALPADAAVYPVIGNNDSYGGGGCPYPDYCTIAGGPFLSALKNIWSPSLNQAENEAQFLATFPKAGYYHVVLPHTDDHIIVLNTVLFSEKASGPNTEQAAQEQLNWLRDQLQNIASKKQKAWILFHIPPGVDAYSTTTGFFHGVIHFWKEPYEKQFLALIKEYDQTVALVLSGHTHLDGVLILDMSSVFKIIDSFVPSISPIFGNNPGYKIYRYDPKNFEMTGMTTFYLDIKDPNAKWQ